MKKQIKAYGDSLVIRLFRDEVKIFNIKEGDVVEIPDEVFLNKWSDKSKDDRKKIKLEYLKN
jgi:hypothetical protein